MAYALSFAAEFFWGDPDIPPETLPLSVRPTCVYQALNSMAPEDWHLLAHEVFGVEPEHLEISTVIARIVETNTCRNLDTPVEVLIDREGFHTVLVY